MGARKVSVIIPTMNEEESIAIVIEAIKEGFTNYNSSVKDQNKLLTEILVVDTNSKDRTCEIAESLGARVISEPRRGYGRAYKTGFFEATGDVLATADGDCTYPVEKIPEFAHQLFTDNLDFITTNRIAGLTPGSMSGFHKMGNTMLSLTMRMLFSARVKDSQSGMWVFRKDILGRVDLTSDGMPFSEEIKIEAWRNKLRAVEIPIEYRIRKGEVKLSSWGDGWKNFKFLFSKRLNI